MSHIEYDHQRANTYTMAWLRMHVHATFVCLLRACGLSSRDTACTLAILSTSLSTDQLIILTPCQTDEKEEPFLLHTFSSWLWTCWTIRSKATKFSPPGETMEGDCYNKAHNSIILRINSRAFRVIVYCRTSIKGYYNCINSFSY